MTVPYTSTLPQLNLTPSAYRNSHLADRVRERLFNLLGPYCAGCGEDLRGMPWEANHIYRREWKPRELSRYRRALRYWREAQEGLIDLRCRECNNEYRPRPLPEARAGTTPPDASEPF